MDDENIQIFDAFIDAKVAPNRRRQPKPRHVKRKSPSPKPRRKLKKRSLSPPKRKPILPRRKSPPRRKPSPPPRRKPSPPPRKRSPIPPLRRLSPNRKLTPSPPPRRKLTPSPSPRRNISPIKKTSPRPFNSPKPVSPKVNQKKKTPKPSPPTSPKNKPSKNKSPKILPKKTSPKNNPKTKSNKSPQNIINKTKTINNTQIFNSNLPQNNTNMNSNQSQSNIPTKKNSSILDGITSTKELKEMEKTVVNEHPEWFVSDKDHILLTKTQKINQVKEEHPEWKPFDINRLTIYDSNMNIFKYKDSNINSSISSKINFNNDDNDNISENESDYIEGNIHKLFTKKKNYQDIREVIEKDIYPLFKEIYSFYEENQKDNNIIKKIHRKFNDKMDFNYWDKVSIDNIKLVLNNSSNLDDTLNELRIVYQFENLWRNELNNKTTLLKKMIQFKNKLNKYLNE